MRKYQVLDERKNVKIFALDDDATMTLTLQSFFQSSGYDVDIETDPMKAIDRLRDYHYDILLLDFLMTPICGDKVVEAIREFNADIFIILLTGHKSMAPPIKTIRELNIQGYFEKSDNFGQLELLVESCVKSINHISMIREYQESLEDANNRLIKANDIMQNHFNEMVTTMRSIVDARDIYTRGHSDRVSFLSEKLSIAMGRSQKENERVKAAGLFHDIGKMKIPDSILLKDGAIDTYERLIMQEHPKNAVNILSNVSMFSEMIPGVLHHHEKYNGSGYPDGLVGEQICQDARIICVADAFDAMTSFRRYRINLSVEQAKEELVKGKGSHFDPNITDIFIRLIDNFDEIKNDPNWIDPYIDIMRSSGQTLLAYE